MEPAALEVIGIHTIVCLKKAKKTPSINFPTSLQPHGGRRRVAKRGSLVFQDSSRSVKANYFATSANICMLLSSSLYPCHSKCFSFSSVYRNGQETPPPTPPFLSSRHSTQSQIYSGSSAPLVASICLKQTLRAPVCH